MSNFLNKLKDNLIEKFPQITYLVIYGSGAQLDYEAVHDDEKIHIDNDLDILILVDDSCQCSVNMDVIEQILGRFFQCPQYDFLLRKESWLRKKRNTLFQYDLIQMNKVIIGSLELFQAQLYPVQLSNITKLDLFDYYVTRSWAIYYLFAQAFQLIDHDKEKIVTQTKKLFIYVSDMTAISNGSYSPVNSLRIKQINEYIQSSSFKYLFYPVSDIQDLEESIKTNIEIGYFSVKHLYILNVEVNSIFFKLTNSSRWNVIWCITLFLSRSLIAAVLYRRVEGLSDLGNSIGRTIHLRFCARATGARNFQKRFSKWFSIRYFGEKL